MDNQYCCQECGRPITQGIYLYSTENFPVPLCLKHQTWISEINASPEAVSLYFALKSNRAPVELEYWDGQKTIDIAIPGKFYIEVDGKHHYEPDQALTDFLRAFHAWKDHIPTFRISNDHIQNSYYFGIIVERLTDLCDEFRSGNLNN